MECPRCVAERRARWAMFALLPAGASAAFHGGITCALLALGAAFQSTDRPAPWLWARGLSRLPLSVVLLTMATVVVVLVRWFKRRASTLLPPPASSRASGGEGLRA